MEVCEYGSEFDWQANEAFLIKEENNLFSTAKKFRSGRDAMKAVAAWAKAQYKTVLLPALCCESMVSPFTMHGIAPVFYKLNPDYTADLSDVNEKLTPNSILLYGSYFGIAPFADAALQTLRETRTDVLFMEDCTQDVLMPRETGVFVPEVTVASIRKWIPIADGGLLWTDLPILENGRKETRFAALRKEAMEKKSAYLQTGDMTMKDHFRHLLGEAAELLDESEEPCLMTADSKALLGKLDFAKIYTCRRKNAAMLQESLKNTPDLKLIAPMPACSTIYFPIWVKDQVRVQTELAKLGIYCPVIWPVPEEAEGVCAVSEDTAEHMLGVPCDQRYTPEDMKVIGRKIVEIVHE